MTEPAVDAYPAGAAPAPGSPAGLDLDRLAGHLAAAPARAGRGPLRAQLIAGGKSNLTYLLADGDREVVLRRPPLGHVLATAHDMAREYRVISALAADRRAGARARCCSARTPTVLGAPFYLMGGCPAWCCRTARRPTALGADQRRRAVAAR